VVASGHVKAAAFPSSRCADELYDVSSVSDETWQVLAANYDERQLIELIMLVGHYHLVCFAANALGVQREPGVPGLDR
jgi:alkylhydroperoxidase family enzyme